MDEKYSKYHGDLAYTIVEDFDKISDYRGQTQVSERQYKAKVIKVDTDLSDEEVLATFKKYTDFMKELGDSKMNEYIEKNIQNYKEH